MARQLKRKRRAKGEGAVYQDPKTKQWIAQLAREEPGPKGQIRYRRAKRKTQAEALKALDELKDEEKQGVETAGDQPYSLGKWLDKWLEVVVKPTKAPKTYEYYEMLVRLYVKTASAAERKELRKVRTEDLQQIIAYWQTHTRAKRRQKQTDTTPEIKKGDIVEGEPCSYSVLLGIKNTLRSALTWAIECKRIARNPAGPLRLPAKPTREKVRFLSREEAAQLLAALKEDHQAAENLVRFGLATGMRLGEVLGLTWDQIDPIGKQLFVAKQLQRLDRKHSLKSLKSPSARRGLPLTEDAFSAVRAEEDRQGMAKLDNPLGLVFLNPDGRTWHKRNVGERLDQACWRAGIPLVTFHALRHSAATFMLMDGVPLHTVSKWLGHASVTLTSQLYGHVLPDSMRDAANTLQRAYLPTEDPKTKK